MSIFARKKTGRPGPASQRPSSLRLPTSAGTPAVFACILSALLLPYLLRTMFFSLRGAALTPSLQSAITLLSVALATLFLGIALLRYLRLPLTLDSAFYAAFRLFCFTAPAFYLTFALFRFSFRGGSFLPRNPLALVLALLAVYGASHTLLWAAAILCERDALLPSASLWGLTWKIHLKNPLSTIARNLMLLVTFWCGVSLFPLLSGKVLSALYGTVWGSVLLAVVYAVVLTVFVRIALQLTADLILSAFPPEETELVSEDVPAENAKTLDIELTAKENARNNPSSAEELLIERGLLTNESAYGLPAARITDGDIPVVKAILPEKWTFRDLIPLVILAVLLIFLGVTALMERTTAAGTVAAITSDTRAAAALEQRSGNTAAASEAYMNGLGDLEAFDAYFGAIPDANGGERPNAASARLETYSELFKTAEGYSDTSSLPYLLEAKLLLRNGRPDLAAEVLEYMIDYEYATDETYLLLLTSLKATGDTRSAAYKNARKVCISRRSFTDSLSYLDSLSVRDASVISQSMSPAKNEFYRNGQLLLWQSYRESGEIETAYNGLNALLEDERFAEDLDVLRAFIETGNHFHVRFDGTTEGIDEAYRATAEKAHLYDRLYTISLAAHESTTYTLLDVKHFVATSLVSCRQYADACDYLRDALGRYTDDDELINLYRISYTGLTAEERETIPPYEQLQFHR